MCLERLLEARSGEFVEVRDFRAATTVHAHILLVHDTTNVHAIEDIAELRPHLEFVVTFTFVVEAIDARDRSTLVVASQLRKVLYISLRKLLATIHAATQEN